MTRTEYLAQLKKELRQLPKQDFQEALDYFSEYFDEAGSENESSVIAELGTPAEAATDIIKNLTDKTPQSQTPIRRKRSGIEITAWIVLIILASPLLLLALACVGLVLLAILTFIIGIIIATVALLVGGFATGLAFIFLAFVSLGETLMIFNGSWSAIGIGLGVFFATIGIGSLILLLVFYLAKLFRKGIAILAKKCLKTWQNRKWGKR